MSTIDSIQADNEADPPVAPVERVPRVHRVPCKHRCAEPIDPVHPRRRHISPRAEISDLCEIKEAILVLEDQCLRHYFFEAFGGQDAR